jgi:hypothetical protein
MPDAIRIFEPEPDGKNSFNALMERMNQVAKRSDDMSDTFKELTPGIRDEFRYEFSDDNPAGWKELSSRYWFWKKNQGYPTTIGIMTGALKSAVTDNADVTIGQKEMVYAVNDSVDYAQDFNEVRKIFPYVREKVRALVKSAVSKRIDMGKQNG